MTGKINPFLFFAQVVLLGSAAGVNEAFFPGVWEDTSFHKSDEPGICRVFPDGWHELYICAEAVKVPRTSTSTEGAVSSKLDVRSVGSGLDGTGMTGRINPFLFFVQVGEKRFSCSCKDDCRGVLVVPSPHALFSTAVKCCHKISMLLMRCGDIEANPGPETDALLKTILENKK